MYAIASAYHQHDERDDRQGTVFMIAPLRSSCSRPHPSFSICGSTPAPDELYAVDEEVWKGFVTMIADNLKIFWFFYWLWMSVVLYTILVAVHAVTAALAGAALSSPVFIHLAIALCISVLLSVVVYGSNERLQEEINSGVDVWSDALREEGIDVEVVKTSSNGCCTSSESYVFLNRFDKIGAVSV